MGVWDFLGTTVSTVANTINMFNPFAVGLSLAKMVIGALVLLVIIIIFTIWMFKSDGGDSKEGARFRWRK